MQVNNVHKAYGDNVVLSAVSLTANRGDRMGLVGPNGSGKTTLLRILVGQEKPDQGSVSWQPSDLPVGYLEQALTYAPGAAVGEVMRGELAQTEREVQALADQVSHAAGPELERLLAAYARALERFEAGGGYRIAAQIDAILHGLGLQDLDHNTPVEILSGGQKTRLALARLLMQHPQFLLLDEPTNHLDIKALEWLETFLAAYDGAMLIVSHDRTFLDRIVNTILELDPLTHSLTPYPGSYTDYIAAKEQEREKQLAGYKDQQDRIARYRRAIGGLETYARGIERGTINFGPRKIAKGLARKAVVQKRRLERLIESEDYIDKPRRTWQMKLDLADAPAGGSQDVLVLKDICMGFDERPLFADVNLTLRARERVVLTGPNGSGKTTLLRIVMGQLEPQCGQVRFGPSVQVGYYAQEQETLDLDADPFTEIHNVAAMDDTEVRSFLHYFLFTGDDVFVPIGALSLGERARLAMAKLVAQGCNLLILDEPINHLDIPSREQFEQGLNQFEGAILAVVHDRYFIRRFATRLWAIHDGAIHDYIDLEDMHRGLLGASGSPQTDEEV